MNLFSFIVFLQLYYLIRNRFIAATMSYLPKRNQYEFSITQEVQNDYFPPHLIQIKAANEELNNRIEKFMERKRADINAHNNTEFFQRFLYATFSIYL